MRRSLPLPSLSLCLPPDPHSPKTNDMVPMNGAAAFKAPRPKAEYIKNPRYVTENAAVTRTRYVEMEEFIAPEWEYAQR